MQAAKRETVHSKYITNRTRRRKSFTQSRKAAKDAETQAETVHSKYITNRTRLFAVFFAALRLCVSFPAANPQPP